MAAEGQSRTVFWLQNSRLSVDSTLPISTGISEITSNSSNNCGAVRPTADHHLTHVSFLAFGPRHLLVQPSATCSHNPIFGWLRLQVDETMFPTERYRAKVEIPVAGAQILHAEE